MGCLSVLRRTEMDEADLVSQSLDAVAHTHTQTQEAGKGDRSHNNKVQTGQRQG